MNDLYTIETLKQSAELLRRVLGIFSSRENWRGVVVIAKALEVIQVAAEKEASCRAKET